jgi:hypothetical protein
MQQDTFYPWRSKAAHYRKSADTALSQSMRKIFLDLALNCESLADREEGSLHSSRTDH